MFQDINEGNCMSSDKNFDSKSHISDLNVFVFSYHLYFWLISYLSKKREMWGIVNEKSILRNEVDESTFLLPYGLSSLNSTNKDSRYDKFVT